MGKKKIVLDTNVLISAVGWKGKPRKIFDRVVAGELLLIMSYNQFAEFVRVLDYPKFDFSDEDKKRAKTLILKIAVFVKPSVKVKIVKADPDDNMIMEEALEGEVDYVITGDRVLRSLDGFRGIRICSPNEFLRDW